MTGGQTCAKDAFPELRLETDGAPSSRRLSTQQSIRLKTSEASTRYAAIAMMFAVFADAINLQCQAANLPLLTTPGAHPNSFPSLGPFDPTTALYVISGTGNVGMVISSFLFGWLATKIGSRNCSLILMGGSVVGSVSKYFARSYWAFFVATFFNSLFGSSVAVGNGYMTLIFKGDRAKIDAYIGYLMATMVFSRSLGGIFSVMFPAGLFTPLIPSAVISAIAFFVVKQFVLEPDCTSDDDEDSNETDDAPTTLDKGTFANIIVGAFVDNIGSSGLVPLAFAPMLYQKFYLDFEMQGLDPIMLYSQYIWLYSLIAITVIPAALLSPWFYQKLGVAITCVVGNALTGFSLLGLVFAAMRPATMGNYILCVCLVYIGFPLGVLSNLTTSPMLDRVSPLKMKTLSQGLNTAIFDLAGGFTPILLGYVSDLHGYVLMLWICVGVQAFAVLANLPLLFNPLLKTEPLKEPLEVEAEIDEAEIEKLLQVGEYVSLQVQYKVNKARADNGVPYLRAKFGKYTKGDSTAFSKLDADLEFVRNAAEQRLAVLHNDPEAKKRYMETMDANRLDEDEMGELKREMGEWIADYFHNNGYLLGLENPQIFKGLFVHSFPPIIKGNVLTIENVEEALAKSIKRLNHYVENLDKNKKRSIWKKMH